MAAGALPSTLALRGDRWTGNNQQQQERGVRRLATAGTTPRIRMIRCRKAADEDAVKDGEGTKHDDTLAHRGRHAGAAAAAVATTMMEAFQDMNAKLQEHAICCAAMHCVYCDVLPRSRNCQAHALSPSPSSRLALQEASSSHESKKPLRLSSTSWDLLD